MANKAPFSNSDFALLLLPKKKTTILDLGGTQVSDAIVYGLPA